MSSIKLSPKYGVNPTIPTCFWCGKEKNEIILMGQLKGDIEAPKNVVLDYEPCEECKKRMDSGFTIIEATTYPNNRTSIEMQRGIYPTGRYVVLTHEAVDRIFPADVDTSKGKAFMTIDDFTAMFCNDSEAV